MHEIVKYFILTEIRSEIVNFRSRSDLGDFPRDLAHSRCMEQCMVADLSKGELRWDGHSIDSSTDR